MKIRAIAPRGKDLRTTARLMTLEAEGEREEAILGELYGRIVAEGVFLAVVEPLGLDPGPPGGGS